MTTDTPASIFHKAKVKSVCVLVLLCVCVPLAVMDVPGPCRHSITKDHLLQIRHLVDNQLQGGCNITYTFIQRGSLSNACYVKAALPRVLELFSAHFRYSRSSNNSRTVQSLKQLIDNIYSQDCVPALNEELEEDPGAFARPFLGSPREALQRAEQVLSLYLQMLTERSSPVDWSCEREYSSHTHLPPSTAPATEHLGLNLQTESQVGEIQEGQEHQRETLQSLYWLGFIVSSVCGGLFLILTIYSFIAQQKLRERLKSQMSSNLRLQPGRLDIEMEEQSSLV